MVSHWREASLWCATTTGGCVVGRERRRVGVGSSSAVLPDTCGSGAGAADMRRGLVLKNGLVPGDEAEVGDSFGGCVVGFPGSE